MTPHAFYYAITRISDALLGAPYIRICFATARQAPYQAMHLNISLPQAASLATGTSQQPSAIMSNPRCWRLVRNLASTMEELQQQAMATAAPLSDDITLPFLDLEEVLA